MKKISGSCYLNRAEAIAYLMHGYGVIWCRAYWSREFVTFSFEAADGNRLRTKVPAYKLPKSRIARVRKEDLDDLFAPAEKS